jgi:hypothetical protein
MKPTTKDTRDWIAKQLIGTTERGWVVLYKHAHGTRRIDDDGEHTEANARLIAAAPDMLAALRILVEFVRDAGPESLADEIAQADAAIAKATR